MNIDKDEIIIGVSKNKVFIMTLIVTGLFSLSVWFLTTILIMPSGFDKNFLMTGISLLVIVFGMSIISGLKKLIGNKAGIIINDSGINIYIGPNQGQILKWDVIKEVKFHKQVQGSMFLLIFVKNPTDVLQNAKLLNRFLLKMNNVSHKTPVSITSTWLESDLIEIKEIIDRKMIINGA